MECPSEVGVHFFGQMLEVSLQHAERQNQNAELGLVLQCVVDPLDPKDEEVSQTQNRRQTAIEHL